MPRKATSNPKMLNRLKKTNPTDYTSIIFSVFLFGMQISNK
jgi:hypothetical protein